MAEALFSPSWYRVAPLRPAVATHAQIHRHHYRGQLWYVIQDHSSGRNHRLSPAGYALVGLMDGDRTVQEIWDAVTTRLGDDAPTQVEIIRLLGQLHAADLLHSDVVPDSEEIAQRSERHRRVGWMRRLANPLRIRVPLLDPDAILGRFAPLVRPLSGKIGALLWGAVVVLAFVVLGVQWEEFTQNVTDRILVLDNALALLVTYVVMKLLHELGHGLAVKIWGGEVHEMGVTFLVLVPVPYVDASSASALRDRRRRIAVGAAGMGVDLLVAALALLVWASVESGDVRAIAHNVVLIGAASTLIFNANPLLRFDGYYVLSDLIEIPNLSRRSSQYLGSLILRHLFGARDAPSPVLARGEKGWLACYGVAAFFYRGFVIVAIILMVGSRFFTLGVAIAIWAALTQIGAPLARQLIFLFRSPLLRETRARSVATSAAILAACLAFFVAAPVPLSTRAEGVVWLPERAHVRAGSGGFVREVLARSHDAVSQGDVLIEIEDPLLDAELAVLEHRTRGLRARYYAVPRADIVRSQLIRQEIEAAEAELAHARERARHALIRSPSDGVFVLPGGEDLRGRLVRQGELVAYVTDLSETTVRVVVSQDDIGLVRGRTKGVEVRLADRVAELIPAAISREVPAATNRLPSPVLGRRGGGRLAVDPEDPDGTQALEKIFQLDLTFPDEIRAERAGLRVYVRFDHGSEPLVFRSYRSLRRLFLRRFGV